MDMKEKILITDVTAFPDKITGEFKTRVGFILPDKKNFNSNKSYKGYPSTACFYPGKELLNKIPDELLLASVMGTLVSRQSVRDPMKSYLTLKEVEFQGHVFTLLQD